MEVVQEEPETCPKIQELMDCSADMRTTIADLMDQKATCECRMKRIELNDEIRNLRNESLRIDNELVNLRRNQQHRPGLGLGRPTVVDAPQPSDEMMTYE